MIEIRPMVLVFLSALAGTGIHAQETIGELLDAGGNKLTKEAMIPILSGATITGLSTSGKLKMNIKMDADGTLSGYVTAVHNNATSGSTGTWTVDDAGRLCIDERLTTWNMKYSDCWFMYLLKDQTFKTLANSEDRSTKIVKSTTEFK